MFKKIEYQTLSFVLNENNNTISAAKVLYDIITVYGKYPFGNIVRLQINNDGEKYGYEFCFSPSAKPCLYDETGIREIADFLKRINNENAK